MNPATAPAVPGSEDVLNLTSKRSRLLIQGPKGKLTQADWNIIKAQIEYHSTADAELSDESEG